ncbi:hypothetical protein BURK1_03158 [Burkholderiales bacterium]|nr:hypothetical protein BURK1_03158 [Burkholderiales bacterium]
MGEGALAAFQDAFAQALLADDVSAEIANAPPEWAALVRHPAFAVYRNTVTRGLVDAIVANHPAVLHLVGDEWLRAAATVYARRHPPGDPSLLRYGDGFDRFLASFPPAADLRYLADVALLDRAWSDAHGARDDPVVDPATIAALAPERLAGATLVPHAAARWHWSDELPIHALWTRSRRGDADLGDLAWRGEGVLVTRPRDAVEWIAVGRAACAFLDACAHGRPLADAAAAASRADRNADLARLMAMLLDAGAFARLVVDAGR